MRVTWAILTLGLLWTTHVQSEDTDVTTKATTAVTPTTAKVTTTPPTTAAAPSSTITTAAVTNAPTTAMSAPAATSATTKVAVTAAATAAPAAAASATTVAVVPTTVPAPPGSNTSKDSADKTTGTVTTISPTSKTIPPPKDVPTTSPNSGSTPSVSGSPTVSGDKAISTHDANSTSDPGSLSSSSNTSSSPSPSVSVGVTSGSVPTSTQPSTTTAATTLKITTVPTTTTTTLPTTTPAPISFSYLFSKTENSQGDSTLGKLCSKLLEIITDGNCSLSGKKKHNGDYQFEKVIVHGDVNISVVESHYNKEVDEKKPDETKESSEESDYTTLIAILASCGAVALIIVCLAIYTYRHGKNYRKNQQHLTEELQTVENGYHDNPTLEVMEVQQETAMEKRPNGEFNDSWIVPIDNLIKDDPDEEDTHL